MLLPVSILLFMVIYTEAFSTYSRNRDTWPTELHKSVYGPTWYNKDLYNKENVAYKKLLAENLPQDFYISKKDNFDYGQFNQQNLNSVVESPPNPLANIGFEYFNKRIQYPRADYLPKFTRNSYLNDNSVDDDNYGVYEDELPNYDQYNSLENMLNAWMIGGHGQYLTRK